MQRQQQMNKGRKKLHGAAETALHMITKQLINSVLIGGYYKGH